MTRTAFRGEILSVGHDPRDRPDAVRHEPDGLLVIEDGMVVARGHHPALAERFADVPTETVSGLIVPGFVDAHVHYPQLDRIAAHGAQLLDWLDRHIFPAERAFADRAHADAVAGVFLDELLRNGTTSALVFPTVHAQSVDALFEAALARRMRLVSGKVLMDLGPDGLADTPARARSETETLIRRWQARGRLGYAVMPRFALTSSDAQLQVAGDLVAAHPDVLMHTHLSENVEECAAVAARFPDAADYLDVYDRFGLVGARSVFAHGVHLSDRACLRLAESGAGIAVCPSSNLFLGSGFFDFGQADAHRLRLGLGTDIGAGTSLSLLHTAGLAYQAALARRDSLDPFRALYLAPRAVRRCCISATGSAASSRARRPISSSSTARPRRCWRAGPARQASPNACSRFRSSATTARSARPGSWANGHGIGRRGSRPAGSAPALPGTNCSPAPRPVRERQPPRRGCPIAMKLADLAVLAGVSTATVSRALAGHPSVNAQTRERIQALAHEHDVRPNQLARNLRLKSTGAIGLVLPLGHARTQHLTDPFFLTLLGMLADLLVERGYDILLSRVIPDSDDWLDRLVDSGRIDGLLLVGQSDQVSVIERVAQRYRPLVVWGAHRPDQHHLTIGSDNVAGGRLAAHRLIDQGGHRLLFVGDPAPPEFADRLAGFAAVAAEAGLRCEVLPTSMVPEAVHAAMAGRLEQGVPPDGIFAASDVAAMSVLRALSEARIDVPGTTAVIGYDDVTLAAHTSPALTTIRQDLAEGAALMVDRLMKRIDGQDPDSAIVPPELVLRQSA